MVRVSPASLTPELSWWLNKGCCKAFLESSLHSLGRTGSQSGIAVTQKDSRAPPRLLATTEVHRNGLTAPTQRCQWVHPPGLWHSSIYPREATILPWGFQRACSLPGSVLVASLLGLLQPSEASNAYSLLRSSSWRITQTLTMPNGPRGSGMPSAWGRMMGTWSPTMPSR